MIKLTLTLAIVATALAPLQASAAYVDPVKWSKTSLSCSREGGVVECCLTVTDWYGNVVSQTCRDAEGNVSQTKYTGKF